MLLILCSLSLAQDGIVAKGATISPYVDLGAALTPNIYRTPGNPKPAAALLVRPGLRLDWKTQDFELDIGAVAARRQVLLVLGDDVAAWQLSRTDLDGSLGLVLRPNRPLSVLVRETAGRSHSLAPSSLALADGKGLTVRQRALTQAGLRYRPGGGALSITLLGRGDVDQHNVTVGPNYIVPSSSVTRLAGGGDLEMRWAFFPHTDLVIDGNAEAYAWTGALLPGWAWRASAGLFGRVNYPLVLNLAVGFAQQRDAGVVSSTPIEGVTVSAAAIWRPTSTQMLRVGYTKDMEDSWYAAHLTYHQAALRYKLDLGRRTSVTAQGSARFQTAASIAYSDVLVSSDLKLDYALSEQLSVGAQAGYKWRAQAGWDVPVSAWIHMGW